MTLACISVAQINERNRAFWEHESAEAERRMTDPDLLRWAMADLDAEERGLIPRGRQRSFELALQHAEARLHDPALLTHARRSLARLGGAARRSDALQGLIREVVARNPAIRLRELVQHLRSLQGQGGVINDIDDQNISFMNGGRCKDAPISGLKDRLSRAKKALKSR